MTWKTSYSSTTSLFGIHSKDAINKNEKREFVFDIEVTIGDITKAVTTDKLKDTFDYKKIITAAESVMNGPTCVLIETIASRIADNILLYPQVEKIKLTLSKRELLHQAVSGISLVQVKP